MSSFHRWLLQQTKKLTNLQRNHVKLKTGVFFSRITKNTMHRSTSPLSPSYFSPLSWIRGYTAGDRIPQFPLQSSVPMDLFQPLGCRWNWRMWISGTWWEPHLLLWAPGWGHGAEATHLPWTKSWERNKLLCSWSHQTFSSSFVTSASRLL